MQRRNGQRHPFEHGAKMPKFSGFTVQSMRANVDRCLCSPRMAQSSTGIVAIGEVDQAVESTSQCSRVKLALEPENPWFHRTRKVQPVESVIGPSRKRIKEAVPASDAFNCHRSPSRIHCSTVPCSTHSDCPRAFPIHTPRATNTPNRILCNSVFQRTSVKT